MKTVADKLKTAVLMGGIGEERDISLESGRCVERALREAGACAAAVDISPGNIEILGSGEFDVFFVALHGRFGEDGQLQQILEERSLVYTGSGPVASRLTFDKMASKRRFAEAGVQVPSAIVFDGNIEAAEVRERVRCTWDKYVIKPIRQGSSVGVEIVTGAQAAVEAARKCRSEFGDCMIEEFIAGREITVGILQGEALPIIEIRTRGGFYDYHAKYLDEQTEFLFDTITDAEVTARIKTAARDCFEWLRCRGFGRVDFVLGEDGAAYVLEVNTIPGFTTHSLLPMAAAKAGFSMSALCMRIIEAALENKSETAGRAYAKDRYKPAGPIDR